MIGNIIKDLRILKGFKRSELAKASNISYISLSSVEQGRRRPSVEFLEKIASALRVNSRSLCYFLPEEQGNEKIESVIRKDLQL